MALSNIISFSGFIAALGRAFSTAQDELSWTQLAALKDYLHDDGTPKTLNMMIPKVDAAPEDPQYEGLQAPILGLIPPKPLAISEAKIEFQVGISEIKFTPNMGETAREKFLDIGRRDLAVNHSEILPVDLLVESNPRADQSGTMKVSMKVRCGDMNEGYERIITKLAQLQGNWDGLGPLNAPKTAQQKPAARPQAAPAQKTKPQATGQPTRQPAGQPTGQQTRQPSVQHPNPSSAAPADTQQ